MENGKHYKSTFPSRELAVKHYSITLGILENSKQRDNKTDTKKQMRTNMDPGIELSHLG